MANIVEPDPYIDTSNDVVDLTDQSANYVHVLSNSTLYSTPGALYNGKTLVTPARGMTPAVYDTASAITQPDGSVIKFGTALESLTGTKASPGQVLTQWGFGFHQEASGSTLPGRSRNAVLTAISAPQPELVTTTAVAPTTSNTYAAFSFLLRVDLGDGAEVYDVTVPADTYADPTALASALGSRLTLAVSAAPAKHTNLADAGLAVTAVGGKIRITATANGTLETDGDIVPAQIEMTVGGSLSTTTGNTFGNTVVSGENSFGDLESIKLGSGGQTFVFGNDYWGGQSKLAAAAQAIPLVNVIARNLQGKLTIDTASMHAENAPLVLDFRAVSSQLYFNFGYGSGDRADSAESQYITLTVSTVTDMTLPLIGVGPITRTNSIVFTHVDRNAVIYGGRYKNTFNLDPGATFQGRLVGGEGGGIGGFATFPGRWVDRARETVALAEGFAMNLTASSLADAFFQVGNQLSYSGPVISRAGGLQSAAVTYVNSQQLKSNGEPLSTEALLFQLFAGNLFGPAIDFLGQKVGKRTTGLSGLTENIRTANHSDVIVRTGVQLVRGTDYTPLADQSWSNPTAFLTSADNILVGDNPLSITPGIHVLAGGSGATLISSTRNCSAWRSCSTTFFPLTSKPAISPMR